MFKAYYNLTKPGIIYGNILTATAGFLLASKWHIKIPLFVGLIVGTSLVIASACVYNNYIDRGIDKKMARTKKRALVAGTISGRNALIYATLLGLVGFSLLILLTNWLTVLVGVIGFVDYVILYGISKRQSVYGTIVGSISGAAPVVAGYTAVTDRFDLGAAILFLILLLWQMPHFYAIAMYRLTDYTSAGIPVLPRVRGMRRTKVQIITYITAFMAANVLLSAYHYTGYAFMAVMVVASAWWLVEGVKGFQAASDETWGRKMFLDSLVIVMVLSVMLAVGSVLA